MRRNKYIYERLADDTGPVKVSGLLLDVREVRNCSQGHGKVWSAIMKTPGPNTPWGYGLGLTEADSYKTAVEIMDMKSELED